MMRYLMAAVLVLACSTCIAQTQEERVARGRAALSVIGPTARDIYNMTPQQRQDMTCHDIRDRIELQKDMVAAGSSGLYNMGALAQIEQQQCIDLATGQYKR